eukprot:360661_1
MSQLISPDHRIAIVMVGLPARGKSFMAKKIFRYLQHLQIITKIFNFGAYRRIATKNTTVGKTSASFFDPDNKQAAQIRKQCSVSALNDLISWYNSGGQIGILDATNTTRQRRQFIRQFFPNKTLKYNVSVLHIESICTDQSIIRNNIISVKLKNPDYCTVKAQKALEDFEERIKMYEKVYEEVVKEEGSYIKVINVGSEVMGHEVNDYISCRIFYFLMHLHLHRLMQPQQSENSIAPNGKRLTSVHKLAPHMKRASYLMWTDTEDTYKAHAQKYSTRLLPKINSLRMINKSSTSNVLQNRAKVTKCKSIRKIVTQRNLLANFPKESDSEIETEEDFDNGSDGTEQYFDCELCGKTVNKKETTMVDSRNNNRNKVRICEVCLYETDSEDENDSDETELIDIMYAK